jgi:hypothetical protein
LHIQVELVGGAGIECHPRPGRIFVVGPGHTFLALAEAIDAAFARWDVAHLHAFELGDGRLLGLPDAHAVTTSDAERPRWIDDRGLEVTREVDPGDEFAYTFDLADRWQHRCRALEGRIDPLTAYGTRPHRPAIVWGWGWIPDQYGRCAPG